MTANGSEPPGIRLDPGAVPNLLLIDAGGCVIVAGATDVWTAAGVEVHLGQPAPNVLQELIASVRRLWVDVGSVLRSARVAPWPGIAVSIYEVEGGGPERIIALLAEPFRVRTNLRHAQRVYGLSPRELDILRHVLRGAATTQIAASLNIADSTVVAHVKSLMVKTKAANRAALVARVLGWSD